MLQVEGVFESLCLLDHNGRSYVLETAHNPARAYQAFAQLLAHPLQRPVQGGTLYKQLDS